MNDILVKVGADISQFSSAMSNASRDLQNFGKANQQTFDAFKKTGAIITGAGITIASGLGLAVNEAIKFESSFAGVRKTVDASEAEFAALKQGFRDLAKEIPLSVNEINAIGESAGQLGIEKEHILGFTRTMADLGVATNMTSEQAATSLARLANITQMPQSEFDRLGSTVVALGNNLATTESEIVDMSLRLAGAGTQVGMTEAEILSFSGALSSVGIEAEAGGSAFSKVMVNMQLAAEKGGKDLDNFAKVAGMSADEFKEAFEQDASGAIIEFVKGLATAEERGLSAIGILDEMGISEVRMRDALLRAAGASDVFTESLEIGTQAWDDNTALTDEAEERYKTLESQIQLMKNGFIDAAISLGDGLTPAIQALTQFITSLTEKFNSLSESTKQKIAIFLALTSALLLVGGGLMLLIGFLPSLIAGFVAVKSVALAVVGALGAISAPVWIVIGVITALVAALVIAYKKSETFREAISTAFNAVREVVMTVIDEVVEFIQEVWGFIVDWWEENNETILSIANKVWGGISNTITTVMEYLAPFLEGVWLGIQTVVQIVWEVIKTVIRIAMEFIGGIISAILKAIDGDWSGAWEKIKETFSNIWQHMKDFGTKITTIIRDNLRQKFEEMKQAISDKLSQAKDSLVSRFNEMKSNAVNRVQEILSNVRTKFTEIVSIIVSKGQEIVSKGRQKFEELKKAIRDKLTEAVTVVGEKIGEMPGKVTGFFGDMLDSGKMLVAGLINGIKNMAGKAIEAITGVVDGVVKKAKSLLNIKSPSRVFAEIGEFTGMGLVRGMDATKSAVERATERMTTAATPDIDMSYATPTGIKSSLTSAVRGTVDVNNRDERLTGAINSLERRLGDLEVVMDGRTVAKVLDPHIRDRQESRSRNERRWR